MPAKKKQKSSTRGLSLSELLPPPKNSGPSVCNSINPALFSTFHGRTSPHVATCGRLVQGMLVSHQLPCTGCTYVLLKASKLHRCWFAADCVQRLDLGAGAQQGTAAGAQAGNRYDSDDDELVPGTEDRTGMDLGPG